MLGRLSSFHRAFAPIPAQNHAQDKRFLLWDDFRPVQYARETVPTATLLSLFTGLPFEVQTSQSFNDGNLDFEWRRGAVLTAKEQGLWTPSPEVTEEDVHHIQSRFEVFRCLAKVQRMRDVEPCPGHLAMWVRDLAAAHDARPELLPTTSCAVSTALIGMEAFAKETRLPQSAVAAIERELLEMGAVCVRELPASEWQALCVWQQLRPLEQRRVLMWLA